MKQLRLAAALLTAALLMPSTVLAQNSATNSEKPSASANSSSTQPDNSGVNVCDRDANAVTPFQQSNNRSDIEISRDIRRALTKDDSLSTAAKNVKVITANGMVTLRGPVKSQQEKVAIVEQARGVAGPGNVTDQLEITNH